MTDLAICKYCDTVHRREELPGRSTARCVTCDSPLYHTKNSLGAMLAMSITATVAFVVANVFPLITLQASGHKIEATLWSAIVASYDQSLPIVAGALAATLMIAPTIELVLMLWVLVPLCVGARPPGFPLLMRAMQFMRPWRMTEVFLLGVLVAVVKLAGLATTIPGWGAFGVAVMTVALAALGTFDLSALWERAEELGR